MKNPNYIISGILAVAIVILFVLQFSSKKCNSQSEKFMEGDSVACRLPIAYINTDSLLNNYQFYLDLSETNLKKLEDQRAAINKKSQQFQKEVFDYQQKAQNNAYLTRERMQQEETRLTRKQQELEEYASRAEQELAVSQRDMNKQLIDTIVNSLKEFNTPQKYQVILSNVGTDNILYADQCYDITLEVTEFLNARYTPVSE